MRLSRASTRSGRPPPDDSFHAGRDPQGKPRSPAGGASAGSERGLAVAGGVPATVKRQGGFSDERARRRSEPARPVRARAGDRAGVGPPRRLEGVMDENAYGGRFFSQQAELSSQRTLAGWRYIPLGNHAVLRIPKDPALEFPCRRGISWKCFSVGTFLDVEAEMIA
jgi:hypothetical protein